MIAVAKPDGPLMANLMNLAWNEYDFSILFYCFSTGVRDGLELCMKRAVEDPAVTAIVVHGDGKTFPAGADITEFKGLRETRGESAL